MISGTSCIRLRNIMLNEMLTRLRHFSFNFCETVFQSSDLALRKLFRLQEVVVSIFVITGLAFAALCVLGMLSSSVREPTI